MAVSPHLCEWNWEDKLTLDISPSWAKTKFKDSHRQCTNILPSENSQLLVTCVILNHMVPCALSVEGVRKVEASGKVSRTLPTASMVTWWKMSLDPVTSQQYQNNQYLASRTVWKGVSGRTTEVDRTTPLLIPSKAFLRASQLDAAARKVRAQSPDLPSAILLQPSRCSVGWN